MSARDPEVTAQQITYIRTVGSSASSAIWLQEIWPKLIISLSLVYTRKDSCTGSSTTLSGNVHQEVNMKEYRN